MRVSLVRMEGHASMTSTDMSATAHKGMRESTVNLVSDSFGRNLDKKKKLLLMSYRMQCSRCGDRS